MKKTEFGCNTFTVSDEFEKAPYDTLYALKEMGYSYIEASAFGQYSAAALKDMLNKSGLRMLSLHCMIEHLESWFDPITEYVENMQAGTKYIGCPVLRGSMRTKEGYKTEAEVMNRLGKRLKKRGLKYVYHNHNFEFERFGDVCGQDILFEYTDPEYVNFQLDTFWIAFAGLDPVEYIKKFAGRCPVMHLKDMTDDEDKKQAPFAPVGEGVLDFEKIILTALECGVKEFLVEQDVKYKPQLECAKSSSDTIKRILKI